MRRNLSLIVLTFAVCLMVSGFVLAKDITITLWDIRTEADFVTPVLKDAIARFEADNPGVTIKHEPIGNDNYKTRIRTAMAANNEPDIFMTWGSSSLKMYVDEGKVLDLTPYLTDKWLDRFVPAGLDIGKFDGKYYGLPVTSMNAALVFYRKDMFEEYGLEIPETYEDLLDIIDTLKANNIIPFTLANKTRWTGSMYFMYLVDRFGGSEAFKNALNRTGAFNDEPFIKAGEVIQDFVKMGALPDGVNGMDEDTAQSRALIYADRAAMYLMGSWANGSFADENPAVNENIDFFNFPAMKNGGDPSNLIGTPGDNYYSVAKSAGNKELAVEFLKYLTDEEMAAGLVEIGNIPPFNGVSELIKQDRQRRIYETLQKANHIQLWYDQALPLELAEVHLNTTQALFGLQMTPEEAADAMEAAAQDYFDE
ncbi:MAG: extracellular solute-binding protein [Firmicutes bacterium]|nr:extracellular solute-binding protein [Bacillota bacterium]